MKKKKTPQYFIGKFFKFILLVFFVVYTIFPLLWLMLTSIKSKKEMYNFPLEYWPDHPTLINYQEVLGMGNFGRYTLNSFLLALAVGAGAAVFSLMIHRSTPPKLFHYCIICVGRMGYVRKNCGYLGAKLIQ